MDIKLVAEDAAVLKQPATAWDFAVDGDPLELVRGMAQVMIENNGIGLAAPQVGVSKRIFVMGNADKLVACVNPEIVTTLGEVPDQEGCLSFPDLWLTVRRAEQITVKYQTIHGEEVHADYSGLMARVFQHELDHLNGVCFVERVGKLSLEMAQKRRQKRSRKSFY